MQGIRVKRIALVLPNLAGGGAERVTLTLADEFVARGIAADIVLMRCEGELLKQAQTLRIVDLKAPRARQAPLAFACYLREEKPEAVIANMWPLTTACIVARSLSRSKARLVVCEHVALSHHYRAWGLSHSLSLRASIAALYPLADARVTVSMGAADDLAAVACIPRSRFDVIHNPIVVRPPTSAEEAAVGGAWRGWAGKRIITVGALKKQKNQALLIRAFARLAEPVDARLMILGEGPLRGELEALARKLGVAGFIANPTPFYRTDLFVLSSDYEGFGNVIVEALACGLPVTSTDCPSGPAEILENGRWGRLVAVGNVDALAEGMRTALAADHDREARRAPCRRVFA